MDERICPLLSGGLIGLFTGMSVLSLFEVIFWIWRALNHGARSVTESCRPGEEVKKNEVGVSDQVIVVIPKEKEVDSDGVIDHAEEHDC